VFLAVDLHAPPEGRFERQAVFAQELERQCGLGHLRDHGLDLWRQSIRDGPLDVPGVAAAGQDDGAAEPGLFHHPFQGRQTVFALLAHRVEDSAGAEGATGALDQDLIAAFGQGQCGAHADRPSPAVRAAHQCDRQPVGSGPRCPAVGEQFDSVGHRDPQVPFDHDVARHRRVQLHQALEKMTGQFHESHHFRVRVTAHVLSEADAFTSAGSRGPAGSPVSASSRPRSRRTPEPPQRHQAAAQAWACRRWGRQGHGTQGPPSSQRGELEID
jgi:hypothetical protein